MVVMESEHYDSKIARGGQDWKIQNSVTIFSGAGYMTAGPNSGVLVTSGYKTTSPELIYKVNFKKTGTYYLWLRGRGPSTYDDSIHAGLDGAALTTADKIHSFTPSWKWSRATMDGPAASLSITSAGIHTIHLWMREDGFEVDKILLTTSTSSTAPAVTGPAESVRS